MSRDFILKVRLSQDERNTIQTQAKEAEMTVSDFMRTRVLHFRVRQSGLNQNTSRHLARIGANINQIALVAI